MQQKVLVVGDDGINSLGIIRSLGEVGIKSDAIITSSNNKRVHLLKSRYLGRGYVIPKNEEDLLDALLDYGRKNGTGF